MKHIGRVKRNGMPFWMRNSINWITRMTIRKISKNTPDHPRSKGRGVRKTLLMGIFWRILIIKLILLIEILLYEAISRDAGISHLLWYAFRILGLVGIIILFMMVTLESFLRKKIITPLEAIAAANERSRKSNYGVEIHLPFHYWKVNGKSIVGEPRRGETWILKENLITALISPSLEPMTDIKLILNFCAEAHCFEDIYAKIMSVEKDSQKLTTHQLRISSMNEKNREVLKTWIREGS